MSLAQWVRHVPPGLTFNNSTFCPHSVFMCFVWISEQNSDYFPIQHKLIGFYNRDGVCLLRGRDWIFKCHVLPTQCMGSQNKQRLFHYAVLTDWFM
jgi:hypothetical protein